METLTTIIERNKMKSYICIKCGVKHYRERPAKISLCGVHLAEYRKEDHKKRATIKQDQEHAAMKKFDPDDHELSHIKFFGKDTGKQPTSKEVEKATRRFLASGKRIKNVKTLSIAEDYLSCDLDDHPLSRGRKENFTHNKIRHY